MTSALQMEASAAVAIDGGDLTFGSGLLALIRPALTFLQPSGVLALLSSDERVENDLRTWCKVEHHAYLGADGLGNGRWQHLIRRGSLGVPLGEREAGIELPLRNGRLLAEDMLEAVPMPERADPSTGFAPRGAQVEPGGPSYPVKLLERDHTAPPEVANLYDQAISAQWDATRDIPWSDIEPLPESLEWAVGQIMTFLAENELSALYVPAKFLPRIHPHFAEVAMLLAAQLNDEARHIDVFLKRARAKGGGLGISAVVTSQSLLSLLQLEDFTEAEFLLSVLGEGTFIDLVKFIEKHAPDEPTRILVQKARIDEIRHVHFGMSHVRHALQHDPTLFGRLEQAVRRRAASMSGVGGVPSAVADSLTILAAGGSDPRGIRKGYDAFRELQETMHENRAKRLENAGFTPEQAQILSDLHTPNFM
jgi:hypothetical protein